ncbi:hypothetical protein PMALA_039300, partial [Plasmodium malariae]
LGIEKKQLYSRLVNIGITVKNKIKKGENNFIHRSNELKNGSNCEKSNKLAHNDKSKKPVNAPAYIDNFEGLDDLHNENNKKHN